MSTNCFTRIPRGAALSLDVVSLSLGVSQDPRSVRGSRNLVRQSSYDEQIRTNSSLSEKVLEPVEAIHWLLIRLATLHHRIERDL